jgi:hypothetical protein
MRFRIVFANGFTTMHARNIYAAAEQCRRLDRKGMIASVIAIEEMLAFPEPRLQWQTMNESD